MSGIELHTPEQAAQWLRQHVRGQLRADSRAVQMGDGFIAWPGAATDGRRHIGAAISQGAVACLVEREGAEAFAFSQEEVAHYAGLKAATGPIAAAFYGAPSEQLSVLAVTGTNGKTSTAWWLAQALSPKTGAGVAAGACAVVGTLGMGVPPELRYTGMTTPDPVMLQGYFREIADQGMRACAIEASSIGIAERRLDGTRVAVAVFTNFTQDHLDYHGSMEAYWAAKAELFRWPGLGAAVVNVDDVHGASLAASLADLPEQGRPQLWTVSAVGAPARLAARDVGYDAQGLRFAVTEDGQPRQTLSTGLIGQYNVANLLGVIGALRALGMNLAEAVAACQSLGPVPGRMERVDASSNAPLVVVDYAHTPDAIDKALAGLQPLARQRGGRLWCLFGCGGDRDPIKRPMMGAVAESQADCIMVTSDNPRSESPDVIISQILRGLSRPEQAQVEPDRARAIVQVIEQADANDVVLLAGRGHEAWQELARGERIAFSDRQHAADALAARSAA